MNNMRNKILSLLVLLVTAATGAWAYEPKVINSEIDYESLKVGDILVEGFSISGLYSTKFYFNAGRAKKGETLLNEDVSFFKGYISSVGTNTVITLSADAGDAAGIYTPIDENGQVANAWIVTSSNAQGNSDFHLSGYTYVDPNAEAPITVEWNASTKTGTFEMPGSDVVLTPQYAPAAKWDVVENVEQKPAALEGIIAGQDAAIVTPGQSAQGTPMYAVTTTAEAAPALTAFSATVPTAKTYDDATTLYVWYYIQGQDTPDGQQATEENTFNDSEISATPLKVDILTNKFDLTLSPAPVKNMTVTVAGQAKTPTDEGKVEAVKMQSEVKLKAATGYKFRKVEVKKKEEAVLIESFSIQSPSSSVASGGTITFTIVNIQPANATNQTFDWSINYGAPAGTTIQSVSDDTKSVTVKAGTVSGPGAFTIRAIAKDGSNKFATKFITVLMP